MTVTVWHMTPNFFTKISGCNKRFICLFLHAPRLSPVRSHIALECWNIAQYKDDGNVWVYPQGQSGSLQVGIWEHAATGKSVTSWYFCKNNWVSRVTLWLSQFMTYTIWIDYYVTALKCNMYIQVRIPLRRDKCAKQHNNIIKPARSAGFSRIKKIPYQAPPTQLGPRKCTF